MLESVLFHEITSKATGDFSNHRVNGGNNTDDFILLEFQFAL